MINKLFLNSLYGHIKMNTKNVNYTISYRGDEVSIITINAIRNLDELYDWLVHSFGLPDESCLLDKNASGSNWGFTSNFIRGEYILDDKKLLGKPNCGIWIKPEELTVWILAHG